MLKKKNDMDKKNAVNQQIQQLINQANGYLNAGQNKKKATAYLYAIFSLLCLSFFGLFAIGPTISTISGLNKEYEEGKAAFEKLQQKRSALQSLGAQFVDIQNDLILVENAIPQDPKVAELTRQIEMLTVSNNLIVEKLDTGLMELYPTNDANSPIFSFTFSTTVFGEEQDINSFIGQIINMQRIIGIDKLTTGQENDLYSASIVGRAYFYRTQ